MGANVVMSDPNRSQRDCFYTSKVHGPRSSYCPMFSKPFKAVSKLKYEEDAFLCCSKPQRVMPDAVGINDS
ncbi:hypothetical protein PoB_006298800 [Plakobranchus ocellatus]|uniref:Uncharacterized protein n=1 Tax=Plakobranchus ocellatus TaxID=259542 RepID=A0AAV4CX67_9GAST|nr:hypothetical protein PoB_006298800 [Plakobranchus ocellatus]